MSQKTPEQIISEAQALVAEAERTLNASTEFFRSQGLDPEKARAVLASQIGAKETAEAEALFRKDLEDIDREVAEELARASFANAARAGSGVRRARPMV
ncbi:Btc22 family type III secretion system chaperone [Bordetella genomosp. 13]|uniref:Uncharacterized protein n=1 Tax=Bordetella genomosp. 13 TaxID=463040 RepID=A0A1W6Z8T8_9BORD|nr:hypothetical protein [Bordetella genomosp. 13]ARP93560.1 hypothetical protein CAL15_03680 [Bordetella genomosp. 13]